MSRAFKDATAEPKGILGAAIPLFNRLIDEDPNSLTEFPVKRYYTQLELIQSIEQEIEGILNTRTTAKHDQYMQLSEENVNFGLPEMFGLMDFSHYDGANEGEWDLIAQFCEHAILRYEPRINNIAAVVTGFDPNTQSLSMNIQADFDVKEFKGEVTFQMTVAMGGVR